MAYCNLFRVVVELSLNELNHRAIGTAIPIARNLHGIDLNSYLG